MGIVYRFGAIALLVLGCDQPKAFSWTKRDQARVETFARSRVRDAVELVSRQGHSAWVGYVRERVAGGPFVIDERVFRNAAGFTRYLRDSAGSERPALELRNMDSSVLSPYDILFSADVVERHGASGRPAERAAFLVVVVHRDSVGTYFASISYRRMPGPPKDRWDGLSVPTFK